MKLRKLHQKIMKMVGGVVYFKNTNPHDSRKASHGYVKRVVQKSCVRNYTQ